MKNILIIISLVVLFISCGKSGPKIGPDYSKIKPDLVLDKKQEKQFDEITQRYAVLRADAFAKARSGGKMNREAMMADMMKFFAMQADELKPVLTTGQFELYAEWLQKQIPGRVGWSKEIISEIKTDLNLTEEKASMVDAVNEAFIEAYVEAHDNYHGDNEAAKAYWTEFDNNRTEAMKQVLSEDEFVKYLEITKDVKFKGEHGNED